MKRRKTIRHLSAGMGSCVFLFTIPKFKTAAEAVDLVEVRTIIMEHFDSLLDRDGRYLYDTSNVEVL